MSDAAPHKSLLRDIIVSVLAASGIMAFIVAVAAQFAIDWIREGVETRGLEGFWFPIVVALLVVLAAGTVLVLLALSVLRPRWRNHVWVPALRWVWARRPVSALRFENELVVTNGLQDSLREQTNEALKRGDAARKELARLADASIEQVRTSLEKVSLSIVTKQGEDRERVDLLLRSVEDLNRQHEVLRLQVKELRDAVAASSEANREPAQTQAQPAPTPAPRWRLVDPRHRIDANQDDGKFIIQNLVEGSVARNVRLDNDGVGHFEFEDGAFWADISAGETWTFQGHIAYADREGDVRLKLSWLDEQNRSSSQLYWLNQDGHFRPIYEDYIQV